MENKIHFDRSRQPETVIPERLEVPEACEYRTASGVRIYVLPAPEYGVVRLSFVFRAGSSWQKVPFCASATVNNLAEGSRDMTAQQIAERLDYYGSWFDVSMDRDWSVVTFVCLSKFFDKTLEVARRIMLEPEFPQEELRVYCDKSRQTLAINRTKVDFNARELFAKSLYGASHPYGISSPAERYDDLRREDVRAFYEERYTAAGCFAVMSGDVDDIRLRAVEEFLAGLRPGEAGERADFPAPRSISRAEMPFPGPCSRPSAWDACSSRAVIPISSVCRWSPRCWAVISVPGSCTTCAKSADIPTEPMRRWSISTAAAISQRPRRWGRSSPKMRSHRYSPR